MQELLTLLPDLRSLVVSLKPSVLVELAGDTRGVAAKLVGACAGHVARGHVTRVESVTWQEYGSACPYGAGDGRVARRRAHGALGTATCHVVLTCETGTACWLQRKRRPGQNCGSCARTPMAPLPAPALPPPPLCKPTVHPSLNPHQLLTHTQPPPPQISIRTLFPDANVSMLVARERRTQP